MLCWTPTFAIHLNIFLRLPHGDISYSSCFFETGSRPSNNCFEGFKENTAVCVWPPNGSVSSVLGSEGSCREQDESLKNPPTNPTGLKESSFCYLTARNTLWCSLSTHWLTCTQKNKLFNELNEIFEMISTK